MINNQNKGFQTIGARIDVCKANFVAEIGTEQTLLLLCAEAYAYYP